METLEDFEKIGIKLEGPTMRLEPYEFDFGVIINEKIKTELKSIGMVCGIPSRAKCYLIFSEDRPDLSTLIHEIMHVLDELETHIGDHLEREARAFIVQRILEKTFDMLGVSEQE